VDDPDFRNFAGIYSYKIFDVFYQFAKANMKKRMPIVIAGGCGLNCDWNTNWKDTGLFSEVFVPPVANDSGSAIGTAVDAQFRFTGNPKIEWDVYSGLIFQADGSFDPGKYDIYDTDYDKIAEGDTLLIEGLRKAIESGSKNEVVKTTGIDARI